MKISREISSILLKILISLFISGLLLLLVRGPDGSGLNPIEVYFSSFFNIFTSRAQLINVLVRSTPIIMTGLSVAFAFKAGLFNIGVEGQYIIGSIAGFIFAYAVKLPPFIHPIFVIILAAFFAGIWAMFIGYLKVKFKINEVLSSIMLNWIALYLNNFIVSFPLFEDKGKNSTYKVLNSARIDLLPTWKNSEEGLLWRAEHKGTFLREILDLNVNYSIIIVILFIAFFIFIFNKTVLGYTIKSVGLNRDASRYGGMNIDKVFLSSMFISGAFAGVAGACDLLSRDLSLTLLSIMNGNGFNGITVAFMGLNNAIGIFISGLFFGFLNQSKNPMSSLFQVPGEIVNITLGLIFLFVSIKTKDKN